ncbi:MAG: proline--tRNA ligase [Elusimicrobia bacterium]|nr:proline--tRNA ligase [Elusimicrobiota bacterium]
MRFSNYLLPTLKEVPSDAITPSHVLMLRAGLIRKLASGIYEWLPYGMRVLNKISAIVRKIHDDAGCLEVLLPTLLPKTLWDETGRWDEYGDELIRLTDRQGRQFCLGPTHEEAITELVRNYVRSYKDLPLILYQIQTKFRDEIRPRFGVMRAREFIMKDAYSFDVDEENALKSYERMFNVYKKIMEELSLKYIPVFAKTGLIGGTKSHEFMVISDEGEEEIVYCQCGWGANQELACSKKPEYKETPQELKEVETPSQRTVEEVANFLKKSPSKFIKTLLYTYKGEVFAVLIRGDDTLDINKLCAVCGADVNNPPVLCDEATIEKVTGAPLGFAGPVGLKNIKIYADKNLENSKNMISGANKKDHHLVNINHPRDFDAVFENLRIVKKGDPCPHCGRPLEIARGIEVGHTFYLGTKYSQKMNAKFMDSDGKEKTIVMGCYGIGVSRLVAAIISQHRDDKGIIFPKKVAPFQIEIIAIAKGGEVEKQAEEIYKELSEDFEVLYDDRDVSAGVKFKDADLLGIPLRVVVGQKSLKQGKVEIQRRTGGKELLPLENYQKRIKEIFKEIL